MPGAARLCGGGGGGAATVSLPEENCRHGKSAARRHGEELQTQAAELALRLPKARANPSRLEITRETVTQVRAELPAPHAFHPPGNRAAETLVDPVGPHEDRCR
ncbi:hypothetical protein GCM10010388_66000 [Streptomyces mauvecolor]